METTSFLAYLKNTVCTAFFPQQYNCWCCDKELMPDETALCHECAETLHFAASLPVPEPLDGLAAAFLYNDAIRNAIHRYKYLNQPFLAKALAKNLSIPDAWSVDMLIPVPLNRKRLLQRGFNQSELLAIELSRRCDVPVRADIIQRVRNTPFQAQLPLKNRLKNVSGAFLVTGDCAGKSIVLVDDVVTSGATLGVCATALKQAGAERIYALALASARH